MKSGESPEVVVDNVRNGYHKALLNRYGTKKITYGDRLDQLVSTDQVDPNEAAVAEEAGRRVWAERVRRLVEGGRGHLVPPSIEMCLKDELLFLAEIGDISPDEARIAIVRGNAERLRLERKYGEGS